MQDPRHTLGGSAVTALIVELFRLNGRLLAAGDRLVAPLDLTSARWQVLGAVAMAPSPEPVAHLARDMGLNRQGVQRIVNDLRGEGWLEFQPNPHHRRAQLIVLTACGAGAYAEAARRQIPWANGLAEGLDPATIAVAAGVITALRRRLEEDSRSGSVPHVDALGPTP